jgi:prefoldin subunit 5
VTQPRQPETQLDRIEEMVRALRRDLAALKQSIASMNRRLDVVCGHELQQGD